MNKSLINESNYDKFIFKGSLALECYYDDTNENKELFDNFNKNLKDYRLLEIKNASDKELMVNNLISVFEQIGNNRFTIYEDGDVEYNYTNDKGDELNGR